MKKNIKNILVASNDLSLVTFLQEKLDDRKFYFILATSYEKMIDLIKNENFFAAVVDFNAKNKSGERYIDFSITKKIPTIATIDELTIDAHSEIINYPIIDYAINNHLSGKGYLSDLLKGLEYFYNQKVLICQRDSSNDIPCTLSIAFGSLLFQPILVSSKLEALDILKYDSSIKIIYTDDILDDGSGIDLCKKIKALYPNRELLIFGGSKDEEENYLSYEKIKGEFLKSGATKFLTKPLDKERFNTHILSMMNFLKQKQRLDTYVGVVDKYVLSSITDLAGTIVYASEAFCDISGYSKEELIGSPHKIVRHQDMPSSIYQELWETIKSGHSWKGEIKNKKKNGEHYWVIITIEPIFDHFGNQMGYQSIRFDITDRKRVEELSITDQLTGLYNRRKFDEILEYEFNQWRRHNKTFSIIMLDIDDFKHVNDLYGHPIGDKVLVQTANLLKSMIRKSDTLCRWGGEEFIIICPFSDIKKTMNLAEKIRESFKEIDFELVGNKTISLGITVVNDTDENVQEIISKVDKALYIAKNSGKDCVKVG